MIRFFFRPSAVNGAAQKIVLDELPGRQELEYRDIRHL